MPNFERPPTPVEVFAAQRRDVPVYIEQIGKCVAREMVAIQPQVFGQITKIHFTDGAELKKGDPLFTIDPRPYQAQLDLAQGNHAQNQAVLDLAKTEFARVDKLIATKAVSEQEYDQAKNAVAVAAARVTTSLAAIETAKLNLDYCSIRAPIEGRAGHRLVDIGNVVIANNMMTTNPLLVIERLDPVYADFTVPENELSAVQRNMAAAPLKVEVWLPDEAANPRIGDLTFIDNTVHESTGTVKLRATLPNADHHFWPGRFVRVRLILNVHKDAVLIPARAPQASANGPFVYVVKADSTAELRLVTPGQRHGDLVVIEKGLQPGERVITEGQAVVPGAIVNPVGAKP
ncbi:MAG: efflux RND transporter periplasmic adaptor subunit [Thermoguttaceae bacterium]|jgi:multidrug efflux system membrane fusion protein